MILQHKPDLVVSDVQMPEMNGFQVLEQMRADASVASTPIILLTSLAERAHMRIGMTTGADDYLTKPFTALELREAVSAQINKLVRADVARTLAVDSAVIAALGEQEGKIIELYEERFASSLTKQWPDGGLVKDSQKFSNATVLFAEIHQYAQWAQHLSSAELGDLVRQFYGSTGDTVHLFGAHHMQFVGEGLLAVFVGSTDTDTVNSGLRAAKAALGLIDSAHRVQGFVASNFAGRSLPRFEVSVGLNSGPVTLAKLQDPLRGKSQVLPVGDTVSACFLLQKQAHQAGWKIAASASLVRELAGAAKTGRRKRFSLPERSGALDGLELLGLSL